MKFTSSYLLSGTLMLILALSMAVHFSRNAASGVLGKDESLYISLSKGHYSYDPATRASGSWIDAAVHGMTRTADPPGIFVLLNVWQRVSGQEAWLRLLPYLFFTVGVALVIAIARLIGLPPTISIACGFMPLGAYFMVNHALEIRGYGLELALTYLLIYQALRLGRLLDANRRPSPTQWVIIGAIGVLGMTSRFSFVINSGAIFIILLTAVLMGRRSVHFRANCSAVLVTGTLVAASFAALFLLRWHLTAADPINAVPPDYDMYALPPGLSNALAYVTRQIRLIPLVMLAGAGVYAVNTLAITKTLIAVTALTVAVNLAINLFRGNVGVELRHRCVHLTVFAYPLLAFAMVIALAVIGLHPLSVASRWSLFLQPSWHLLMIGVLRLALAEPSGERREIPRARRWPRDALSITMVAMAMFYAVHYADFRVHFRMGGGQHPLAVARRALKGVDPASVDVWYVTVGAANTFKHQLLYGNLRGKLSADARIVIEHRPVSVKHITAPELADIREHTNPGDRIALLIGHANKHDAAVYTGLFARAFPSAVCGPHERSNEQFCMATR